MRFARIAGIEIKINIFFLIIAIIYGFLGLGAEIIIIFASVILHEIAHTIVGSLLGIKIAEIEMFPFGGQASLESFHGLDPVKEVFTAMAGPLCSLSIAAVFYFLPLAPFSEQLDFLIKLNLTLGLFNFLPFLPLDGGRVLRAALSKSIGFKKATRIAATIGKAAGILMVSGGAYLTYYYFSGANLILVGIMLFWSAHQEGKLLMFSFMRFLVRKKGELSARGFLPARQIVSSPEARIKNLLAETMPTYYMLVVVIDKNHGVAGILSEAELIEQLLEDGPAARAGECLPPSFR